VSKDWLLRPVHRADTRRTARLILLLAALLTGFIGTYTVIPCDTLCSLARTHRTTVEEVPPTDGTTLEPGADNAK